MFIEISPPSSELLVNYGDAINPILAATDYNFRLILKWIRYLWLEIWIIWMANQSAKIA